MLPIRIITTEDGSTSLYREDIQETYHSVKGAMGESLEVYINQGLRYTAKKKNIAHLSVLEVGLGTGLNAWLSALEQRFSIDYTALEPFPLEKVIWSNLLYKQTGEAQEQVLFQKIHEVTWESWHSIHANFNLFKSTTPLENWQPTEGIAYDVIYFDAFAPSKQAEIWSIENLTKCYNWLSIGGVLVTYCAKGQFKRDLKSCGFDVQTLPGAMGKKEMVRAAKML